MEEKELNGDQPSDVEKRKRAPNFTRKEQKLLDELVKVYSEQIYIKSTSAAANAIKARAWQELANDFNKHMGNSSTQRMPDSLKLRWENERKKISREAKRKMSSISSRTSDENDLSRDASDRDISDAEDASNHFDQTQNYIGTMKMEDDEDNPMESDDAVDSEFKEQIHIHITGSKQNQKANDNVNQSFENQSIHNVSNGIDETESFEMLQKRCFLQEHKLRLLQMQQKHSVELDCIKAEHKARVRMMQEEHLRKIKLLELEKSVGIINKI